MSYKCLWFVVKMWWIFYHVCAPPTSCHGCTHFATAVNSFPENMGITINPIFHISFKNRYSPPQKKYGLLIMLHYQVYFWQGTFHVDKASMGDESILHLQIYILWWGEECSTYYFLVLDISNLVSSHYPCISSSTIGHIYIPIGPRHCLQITLQSELTQQKAIPTPAWPAIP